MTKVQEHRIEVTRDIELACAAFMYLVSERLHNTADRETVKRWAALMATPDDPPCCITVDLNTGRIIGNIEIIIK